MLFLVCGAMSDLEKLKQVFDFNLLDKFQIEALEELAEKLKKSGKKNEELHKKIEELEKEKDVSAILSHSDFNKAVSRMLAYDERYGTVSSVIYFDFIGLEKLEEANEKVYGEVVQAISDALSGNIRKSDLLGRVSKREFGIMLL